MGQLMPRSNVDVSVLHANIHSCEASPGRLWLNGNAVIVGFPIVLALRSSSASSVAKNGWFCKT